MDLDLFFFSLAFFKDILKVLYFLFHFFLILGEPDQGVNNKFIN